MPEERNMAAADMCTQTRTETTADETVPAAIAQSAAPGQVPAEADQREHPRYGFGTITLTRLCVGATELSYFAWVHDISESGIGLDVVKPLGAGADIIFELKCTGERKVRVYAQVVHATPAGPFYRLGCKFTRRLRPWVLRAILDKMHDPQAS
jgi:hypothetical protein